MNVSLTHANRPIGVPVPITDFRLPPVSNPSVANERGAPGPGSLVPYARFLEVRRRRAWISGELDAASGGLTSGSQPRVDDHAFGGDDSQFRQPEPRS